jgi:hypothetical protein
LGREGEAALPGRGPACRPESRVRRPYSEMAMRWWKVGLVVALAGLSGCSERVVPVSGTVKTKAGKPVTGVYLVLWPVEGPTTKSRAFLLDAQGAFAGEAYPGAYTFYLSRRPSKPTKTASR